MIGTIAIRGYESIIQIRLKKLFTTEDTKDTEKKIIFLIQHIENFVLSATAPCVALPPASMQSSATAPCVALDRRSRRDSTSATAPCVALPPDLTSMDGGNAARLPGAVAAMQLFVFFVSSVL